MGSGYDDEEQQNRGFIHINAAYLAGLNCGTVIGSAIWEKFGIDMVYYAGAVLSGVLIIFSLIFVGKIKIVSEEEESEGSGKLKDLFTPAVIRFFLFITVPYLICTAVFGIFLSDTGRTKRIVSNIYFNGISYKRIDFNLSWFVNCRAGD